MLLLCGLLAACNAPVLSMRGAQRAEVTAGGFSFNVFHTTSQAEAHRSNMVWRPDSKAVFAAARTAIMDASGCKIDESSWSGDVAVIKVDLLCK